MMQDYADHIRFDACVKVLRSRRCNPPVELNYAAAALLRQPNHAFEADWHVIPPGSTASGRKFAAGRADNRAGRIHDIRIWDKILAPGMKTCRAKRSGSRARARELPPGAAIPGRCRGGADRHAP